jgi:hypothetical protein
MKIKNLFKKTDKSTNSKIVAMDKNQLSQVIGGVNAADPDPDRTKKGGKGHVVGQNGNG